MQNFISCSSNFNLRKTLDIAIADDKTNLKLFRVVYTFFKCVDGSFFNVIRIRSPPTYQF